MYTIDVQPLCILYKIILNFSWRASQEIEGHKLKFNHCIATSYTLIATLSFFASSAKLILQIIHPKYFRNFFEKNAKSHIHRKNLPFGHEKLVTAYFFYTGNPHKACGLPYIYLSGLSYNKTVSVGKYYKHTTLNYITKTSMFVLQLWINIYLYNSYVES